MENGHTLTVNKEVAGGAKVCGCIKSKGEASIYLVTHQYWRRPEVTRGGLGEELKVNTPGIKLTLDCIGPDTKKVFSSLECCCLCQHISGTAEKTKLCW